MEETRIWHELNVQQKAEKIHGLGERAMEWEPPISGYAKCNIHANWRNAKLHSGAALIIRDHSESRRPYDNSINGRVGGALGVNGLNQNSQTKELSRSLQVANMLAEVRIHKKKKKAREESCREAIENRFVDNESRYIRTPFRYGEEMESAIWKPDAAVSVITTTEPCLFLQALSLSLYRIARRRMIPLRKQTADIISKYKYSVVGNCPLLASFLKLTKFSLVVYNDKKVRLLSKVCSLVYTIRILWLLGSICTGNKLKNGETCRKISHTEGTHDAVLAQPDITKNFTCENHTEMLDEIFYSFWYSLS
ncbi:hypothetical protein Bca4012_036145 [Brassica carinata]